jgi:hypothetical protein
MYWDWEETETSDREGGKSKKPGGEERLLWPRSDARLWHD